MNLEKRSLTGRFIYAILKGKNIGGMSYEFEKFTGKTGIYLCTGEPGYRSVRHCQ